VFILAEKSVALAVVWTVHRWCLDCTAGPEERVPQARCSGCRSSVAV